MKGFGLFTADLNANSLYFDPGAPPYLVGTSDLDYKNNAVEVLEYSVLLDPADTTPINLSTCNGLPIMTPQMKPENPASYLYGGIHVSPDDGPGRIMGSLIDQSALTYAGKFWDGSVLQLSSVDLGETGELSYHTIPGYHYAPESGAHLDSFPTIEATPGVATGHENTLTVPITDPARFFRFFRFKITGP